VFDFCWSEQTKKWRSSETLPIIVAGHPTIAKYFLSSVFGVDTAIPANNVAMGNHFMNRELITVKLAVKATDINTMKYNSLIQSHMTEMQLLAEAEVPIDIMDVESWTNLERDWPKTCSFTTWRGSCADCKVC
jgi:hypothetical protein